MTISTAMVFSTSVCVGMVRFPGEPSGFLAPLRWFEEDLGCCVSFFDDWPTMLVTMAGMNQKESYALRRPCSLPTYGSGTCLAGFAGSMHLVSSVLVGGFSAVACSSCLAGIHAGAVFPSIGGRPTFFWTGHEVAALVVDLGSCMLKASFAGDDATGVVFSSIGGKPEMLASWPGWTRRTACSLRVWPRSSSLRQWHVLLVCWYDASALFSFCRQARDARHHVPFGPVGPDSARRSCSLFSRSSSPLLWYRGQSPCMEIPQLLYIWCSMSLLCFVIPQLLLVQQLIEILVRLCGQGARFRSPWCGARVHCRM